MIRLGIIGAGEWGTALAHVSCGVDVTIFSRNKEVVNSINKQHISPVFPDVLLDKSIKATNDISDLLQLEIIIIAIPAQNIRDVLNQIKGFGGEIIIAAKAIEVTSLKLLTEVVAEIMPNNSCSVISGPNFASEIIMNHPAICVIANKDIKKAAWLASLFNSDKFRVDYCADIISVQIAGALKNVLAIIAGFYYGKNNSENERAMIIADSIIEIRNIAVKLGGVGDTIYLPALLGDIILSATSIKSRNMKLGMEIACNMKNHLKLTEGIATAKAVLTIAEKLQVEIPVLNRINNIIK